MLRVVGQRLRRCDERVVSIWMTCTDLCQSFSSADAESSCSAKLWGVVLCHVSLLAHRGSFPHPEPEAWFVVRHVLLGYLFVRYNNGAVAEC